MMGLWVQMAYGRTVLRQEHRLQQTRVLTGPANWTKPAERHLDRPRRPLGWSLRATVSARNQGQAPVPPPRRRNSCASSPSSLCDKRRSAVVLAGHWFVCEVVS